MKIYKIAFAAIAAFGLTGCSDIDLQTSALESALEDAWDAAEEPVEKRANSIIKEIASSPSSLGKNYKAEWDSTFDQFTLVYPLDMSTRAAMSLVLGEWGDSFNDIDSFARENMDEDGVRRAINKNFNDDWMALFLSLIVVDGNFVYEIETDSWDDNTFDFDSSDLYKILKDKGYFQESGANTGMTSAAVSSDSGDKLTGRASSGGTSLDVELS